MQNFCHLNAPRTSPSMGLISANKDGLDLEQLAQLVRDPDEGDLGGAHVDLLPGAQQLVALSTLQELLGADLAQQLLR